MGAQTATGPITYGPTTTFGGSTTATTYSSPTTPTIGQGSGGNLAMFASPSSSYQVSFGEVLSVVFGTDCILAGGAIGFGSAIAAGGILVAVTDLTGNPWAGASLAGAEATAGGAAASGLIHGGMNVYGYVYKYGSNANLQGALGAASGGIVDFFSSLFGLS